MVIKCWNCQKKFTIPGAEVNPTMPIYKGREPSTPPRASREKKRLLKTGPYCGKENEVYV
jgi:hypothetical protein